MRLWLIVLLAGLLLFSSGCAALAETTVKVEKQVGEESVPAAEPVLPEIARELAMAMLEAEWLKVFLLLESRPPLILLSALEGQTNEVEGADSYGQQLVTILLRSEAVKLVVNRDDSQPLTAPADGETALQLGLESQADFFLESRIVDEVASPALQLKLVYLKEFEVVWSESRSLNKIKI